MKVFFFSGEFVNLFKTKKRFRGYFFQDEGEEIAGYLREEGRNSHVDAIKGLFDETANKLLLVKTTAKEGYTQDIYMFIFQGNFTIGQQSRYSHDFQTFSAYGGITSKEVKLDVLTSVSMSEGNIQKLRGIYASLYETSTELSKKLTKDVKKYMWLFNYLKHFEGSAK